MFVVALAMHEMGPSYQVVTSPVTPLLLKVLAVSLMKATVALPISAPRLDFAIDKMAYRGSSIKMLVRTRTGHPQVVQSFAIVSLPSLAIAM
jgi:hypothetical protein